jgi:phosphoribosyl 1,2-cyclic phosphodiesterase
LTGFASLGSGSRGNGTVVRIGGRSFLIDCGFPLADVRMRLRRLSVTPDEFAAVLVTHEHADHARGVAAFARAYDIPVFGSWGTLKACRGLEGRPFASDEPFVHEGVTIHPVPVPHDAREPTQFVLEADGVRIGVLSDLGHVTPHVIDRFRGCDGLLMESNHDRRMLVRGRYPEPLKRRIASDLGHLSNEQAAGFLREIGHPGLAVVVGHISEENNHADLLEACFAPLRAAVATLAFATQSLGAAWTGIGSKPPLAV